MHISQAEVAAGVLVRQLEMIQSQQVQHGGVQVVQMDLVFHREVAIVVGLAVANAPPNTNET